MVGMVCLQDAKVGEVKKVIEGNKPAGVLLVGACAGIGRRNDFWTLGE